jgi:hypothetical protein
MTPLERAVLRRLTAEAATAWDETDEGAWRDRLRRLSIIGHIIRLLHSPPTEPVAPPPPPPIVQQDPTQYPRRRRSPPNSFDEELLEHLGHAAAEASDEAEAEALAGSLIPVAARAMQTNPRVTAQTVPALVQAFARTARIFRQSSGMNPLVRTLPTIARQTMRSIATQQRMGRSVAPASALRILANQLRGVVANSRRIDQVLARSRALDRQYHRTQTVTRGRA